jgi:hypothetical protein
VSSLLHLGHGDIPIALLSDAQIMVNMALDFANLEGYELQPKKSVAIHIRGNSKQCETTNEKLNMGNITKYPLPDLIPTFKQSDVLPAHFMQLSALWCKLLIIVHVLS